MCQNDEISGKSGANGQDRAVVAQLSALQFKHTLDSGRNKAFDVSDMYTGTVVQTWIISQGSPNVLFFTYRLLQSGCFELHCEI